MLALRLILVLLAGGLLLLIILAFLMARGLLRPPRMTDGKAAYLLNRISPGDLGFSFLPLTFTIRDPQTNQTLSIASWSISHETPSDKSVILLHGYADAKVGALAWAPPFHELGYNILALDLRAHGESGGHLSTGGHWERHDITQVIDDLRARYPDATRHLVLFGASLGGTIALALAAERTDIDAIILESPYLDFPRAASAHFTLLGIGLKPLHRAALFLAALMSKSSFSTLRTPDLIQKSHSPILIIQGADDALTPPEDQAQLENALSHRTDGSTYWKLENVPHLMPIAADPDAYREKLSTFLNPQSPIANSSHAPISSSDSIIL